MKKIAILGDSYSTYAGYIPEDYLYWYAPGGNALDNDVASVEDTWWKILCNRMNLDLCCNCSYSGSTVCYTGYPGYDGKKTSFVYRMKREFGNLRNQHIAPDYIFVFGGTNDFWNQSPVGEINYNPLSEDELKNFAPAFCCVMEYMKHNFPKSRLMIVINDDITSIVRDIEIEVGHHYGADVLELWGIDKQNGHPSRLGMEQIADQVIQSTSF